MLDDVLCCCCCCCATFTLASLVVVAPTLTPLFFEYPTPLPLSAPCRYLGPLGRHGRDIVRYLSTVPGMPPYPRGLNPASYMLDALGGTNSSKKDGAKAAVAVVAAATSTPAGADKIAADGGVPEKQQSSAAVASVSSIPSGEVLQASLRGSHVWATAVAVLEKHSVPAPGTTALSFSSRYARSFPVQIQALVVRTWLSYSRNVGLNYGRLIALTMLNLIFGTVSHAHDVEPHLRHGEWDGAAPHRRHRP